MFPSVLVLAIPFLGPLMVLLTIVHVLICVLLIFVVLLQRGRSADLANAFGGGGPTQSNMAAMSTDDFLTRATKIGAFAFMGTSLLLALFSQRQASSVLDTVPDKQVPAAASSATGASAADAPAVATTPITIAPEGVSVGLAPAPAPGEGATSAAPPSDSAPAPSGPSGG